MRGVFVTGTDTGVGKTMVAGALIAGFAEAGFEVAAFKPVAAGCTGPATALRNDDALVLSSLTGRNEPYERVNPVALEPAIAPHIAAAEIGMRLSAGDLARAGAAAASGEAVVVAEGAGGWLVPLGPGETMEDLAMALGLPVVLVVGLRLGCLNHSLLTARAVEASGLTVAGWVANTLDPAMPRLDGNVACLQERLAAPFLGVVPNFGDTSGPDLCRAAFAHIDLKPLVSLLSK